MQRFISSLTAAILIAATPATILHATPVDQSSAEKVVKGFFEAEKVGSVALMEQYAKDLRFTDVETQTDQYQRDFNEHPLQSYKIVSKKGIDDSHVEFTVHETFYDMDPLPDLTYTAFKANGKWQIQIEEIVIDANQSSPDFGKITKSNAVKKSIKGEVPVMNPNVGVVYYGFTQGITYNEYTDSSTFSQSRSDGKITLNGWQEGGSNGPTIDYEVVKTSGGVTSQYDHKTLPGIFQQYGTWYGFSLYSVPQTSGLILRTKNVSNVLAYGAGNVYE